MISLGDAKAEVRPWRKSPKALDGANTQTLCVYVDDVDAHCERARKAGAKIVQEPETHDYGDDYWSDRSYECIDLEGHHWWFMQRMREQEGERELDQTFTALADPTRRGVIDLLRKEPRRASDLADALGASRPAMSKHLRILRASGLVVDGGGDRGRRRARSRVSR